MIRTPILIGLLALSLLAVPALATQRILVLGDSLSAGYGIAKSAGWVSLLQQRLQRQDIDARAINASITGDTTHGGLARLPDALEREQPAIVILELGGNDGLRGLDLSQARDNLKRMIALSRQAGARVLLLGVKLPANYGPVYGKRFHAIYTELAHSEQVPLVDFFLEGVAETPDLMQADGIHPGAAAQPRILDNVWRGLAPMLDTRERSATTTTAR